ncbi:MAG: UDP-N-acetylenolpyruvoylglucosamine reductase, partial [Eubacterium sp.]|nr:UDP-N-acetylenolpyruvoylglucosamine reductase [Eubacterium sp.]
TFTFGSGSQDEIRAQIQEYNKRRREKQPLEYASAGSTFKRPEGFFAGKLIEDAGLKGYHIGGARVSDKHAGFVINTGDATASEIHSLIEHVKRKVLEKSGVMLEPEVKMIGDFSWDLDIF